MADSSVTLRELKGLVEQFVQERDWAQFHTPKNLAGAIAIEAAELMELFQWVDLQRSAELSGDPNTKARLEEELADVFIYCLALANRTGVDVSDAVQKKVQRNALKYPADAYRGHF